MISQSQTTSSLPMDQQAVDFEQLNKLNVLLSILQGMVLNLDLIESGVIGKIIKTTNANLFQIATQEYGDPNQWTTIATANDLTDPQIEPTIIMTSIKNQLIFSGISQFPQTLYFTISATPPLTSVTTTRSYVYYVQPLDTIQTIAQNVLAMTGNSINGGIISSTINPTTNLVVYTITYNVYVSVSFPVNPVQRIVNLVIPQTAGTPSGGILPT